MSSQLSPAGARAPDLRNDVLSLACFACLALPWLNPFAAGPSTWVGPWLFSAMCAAVALAAARAAAPGMGVTAAVGGIAAWGLLRSGWAPETLALAGAALTVWLMAAMSAARSRDVSFVRVVALAWLVAALVSTAAALLQYFGLAEALEPWVNASAAGEAFANLRQRNQFASLTAIGMAALLWLAPREGKQWPALAAMAWLAVGNAATTSRTGLLELLLLGALTWHWRGLRSRGLQLWLVGLGAYLAAAIGLPLLAQAMDLTQSPLWMRVTGIDPCGSRLVLWSNVAHLIAQRPWVGWGWGELDYAHYVTLYEGTRFCDILDNAHNLPLHLAVELGLPAAIAVCLVFAWGVWRARPWRETDGVRQMAWAVVAVLVAHSLLEYPLWYGPFQIALGLCLGLLWPARAATVQPVTNPWPAAVCMVVGAGALAIAGYAAWDYHRASQIYLPQEERSPAWRHDPLARLGGSWLFRSQVRFAELTLAPLTRNNAQWTHERAAALLHYSPEPRVIEKLIESELLLGGRDRDLVLQLARFRAAFPEAYAAWTSAHRSSLRR